jgi:hypothetical protein
MASLITVNAKPADTSLKFYDVQKQTVEFIGYNTSITLTPEQQKIKDEALSAIPAPCCKDYSIKTCCCPCNMAKSVWGLANYLIVKQQFDLERLKQAVTEWLEFTNKNGYNGTACFEGRCEKPFANDGCGGMNESNVVF